NPGICPGDEHNFPISYRPVAVMNLYPALAPYIPQAIKMGQHLMRTLRAQGEFLGRMASKGLSIYMAGKTGEKVVELAIQYSPLVTLVGEQVSVLVELDDGTEVTRQYDFLVIYNGQPGFVEVKSGSATLSEQQRNADYSMSTSGGTI